MPDQRTYTAEFSFDGRAWIVHFDDLAISTFGRSLASAKGYARSLLAVYLEVDDLAAVGAVIVEHVRLPRPVEAEVERLRQMRSAVDALRHDLAEETRRTTSELRKAGLSTRDVGEILGISGARVAQIEREHVAA